MGTRPIGAQIDIGVPTQNIAALFAETQSRIIITVNEKDLRPLLKAARLKKVPARKTGVVVGKSLQINELVEIPTQELQEVWETGFEKGILR